MRVGIDAGGTFTDFVIAHADGRLESFKLRSNPHAPASVILQGLRRIGHAEDVVHGSTVATNALLERKGARTALVSTAGFEDVLAIGRQARPHLYNLTPPPRRPLVPEDLRFGVAERTWFDGAVARAPSGLGTLRNKLRRAGVESVAVCLLHAYQNPDNERAVIEGLRDEGWYLCASHEVSPEYREFERSSTSALNAYVGPIMDRYLGELEGRRIWIFQSNGGFMTAAEARRQTVRTLLSGPAGGVVGAHAVAALAGFRRILGFDMGGTSTDVCLVDGEPVLTTEASIDGFPVRVPVLDIHTVGAGGGSLARVDEGGLLRVGPESAGADPGPACYGTGTQATVTDAHVVLGRIAAGQFLGGGMPIDSKRSEDAIDAVAAVLGRDRVAAAEGILRVANANMERAIRVVSIERGHDPREFALVAFGGCGGLHACEIARELGIRTVLAPPLAGALSALGMLLAGRIRDYSASALGEKRFEKIFARLERQAKRDMRGATLTRSADLRYQGQSYELNVPWGGDATAGAFHEAHERVYGYANRELPVEVVVLRVAASVAAPPLTVRADEGTARREIRRVRVDGRWRRIPVLNRAAIADGMPGPALIADYGATTLVPAGWTMHPHATGTVILADARRR
ncbi:MAG: hydantoinase/oxoprolinase family protein [Bryobacterales bacterium]|nr:hydantoinase/oxoprolinase family protein [Bryobacterales bacterium]